MWLKNSITFLYVILATSGYAFGQEALAKKDTTIHGLATKKDSTQLYKNIETFSKRTRFTKFAYGLFFKPASPKKQKGTKHGYKKLTQKPYSDFEGKIIRHINIESLDPFSYSIADTIKVSTSFFSKTGNKLHLKTKKTTIRNMLLIRQNHSFDSLLVKESERLIRSQQYITDVSFYTKATAADSDSVDIYILVLDNWSIIPSGFISATRATLALNDKNFLGFGHDFKNSYTWYHDANDHAFNFNYFIPNIRNTFINSTIHYGTDEFGNSTKQFSIDRPFFSPFAKWAAGVNLSHQFRNDYWYSRDTILVQHDIIFNTQEYWAGNAMQIFKGNTEQKRTTNFVSAARFFKVRYKEKPNDLIDTLHLFANEDFFIASVGVSTRKYVRDKYIFMFGVTEDVPIGQVYSVTGGYQKRNNINRFYLGARFSYGKYYSWGYLSSNFEYGTFLNSLSTEQAVINAGITYFTGLIEIGKWKFRQFVKPEATIGINRFPYDSLTLNKGYGMDGFNSTTLSGNSRMLLTFQTQSYAPWNFIGFRFGPFISYSIGMLGDIQTGFKESKAFSHIGLGVLIKNANLIINTFQFSISYYPSIPGVGYNVLKLNSLKSTGFGFRDFEIGKPAIVMYQ
jgi:hypothetical protein